MIGIDIVDIKRIERLLEKYGESFTNKIFTEDEILYFSKKKYPQESMAGIFAAKEAMAKAMKTGIGKVTFKGLQVIHENGIPRGKYKNINFELSISHERATAVSIAKIKNNDVIIPNDFKGVFKRPIDAYKGDMGRVGIIAGRENMSGCAFFASKAALRSGAGMVFNYCPEEIKSILQIKVPEAIYRGYNFESLKEMSSICMGPGMGTDKRAEEIFEKVIKINRPMVIDADALTIFSKNLRPLSKQKILTPHLGEFSRLTNLSIEKILSDRENIVKSFAKDYNLILILKGNGTIISEGKNIYINPTGNPGMATAGSGDVLSGIVSALLSRFEPFFAAKLGVYIHGLAGDFAKDKLGQESMTASDIVEYIPQAIMALS